MKSILLRLASRQWPVIRPRSCPLVVGSSSLSSYYPCHVPMRGLGANFSSTPAIVAPEEEETRHEIVMKETNTSVRRFDQLQLHPKSLKALRRQGLHNMTEIQEKSFDIILSGKDVVGRARTGTGKTISFLLPSLERVVQKHHLSNLPTGIAILILSPTRELAAQIGKAAERLVAKHGSEITSQVVYGGSSRFEDIDKFEKQLPTILVATPGRLKDHLATTKLKGTRPFIDALQNLQVLILDETDRLLDMGFRKDIADIVSCLPRKRQTLLFSATLPKGVRDVVQLVAKPDYEMVDCIQDEDPTTQTNAQIQQSYLILPNDQFWTKTMEFLVDLIDKGDNKVMVFFPMTSMVQLYAQIFNLRFGRRVLELHGQMYQRERTTISRRFRNATHGILFTSDVSARGVDYPNVTHVVQIAASGSRETYIHRLGRTGRAGKRGTGILILPTLEQDFLHDLDGLEIVPNTEWNAQWISSPPSKKFMNEMGPMVQDIRKGRDKALKDSIHDAYQAMIPYFFQRSDDKAEAVATVNGLIETMGLWQLPPIALKRAQRLGLDVIAGLNIKSNWKDQDWSTGWSDTDNESSTLPSRPGKPYGDFDGSFGWDDPDRRGNRYPSQQEDGGQERSPKRASSQSHRSSDQENDRDRPSGYHSHREGYGWSEPRRDNAGDMRRSWRQLADERHNKNNRNNKNERSSDQRGQALAKVGWKRKDDASFPHKLLLAKRKSKSTFQRWEIPGEFTFKG